VGLFLLLPFSVLWAQKASAVSDSTGTELEEVVVAGSRWSQALNHVPSQIDVVSRKLIGQFQPQTAADLLGMSGKVFIQKSQQGGGSPMIRGFATNRLVYTVDGVRMNTAIFRSGNIQNVINLDPFATDRVEAMRWGELWLFPPCSPGLGAKSPETWMFAFRRPTGKRRPIQTFLTAESAGRQSPV
jgi:outer membrane cobalamin receptor